MKFFTRSKIAFNVLTVLSVILAAVLVFKAWDGFNFLEEPLLLACCVFLALLIVNLVLLKLIIKDAEEDLTAVMNLQKDEKDE